MSFADPTHLPPAQQASCSCGLCGDGFEELFKLEVPAVVQGALVDEVCYPCWHSHMCKECRATLARAGWDLCMPCARKLGRVHPDDDEEAVTNGANGATGEYLRAAREWEGE